MDAICLPKDSAFTDENEKESTKAHEGIHATGAKHRLDRNKPSYAFEELVAELGAAMVCASLGVPLDKLQHTSYIQSWLKQLKDDTSFVFKAAAEANKAVKYLTREVA
jgi:antirestriction protein ArdC